MQGQQSADGGAVGDAPLEHGLDGLGQRHPAGYQLGLLIGAFEVLGALTHTGGEVHADHLVVAAGAGAQVHQGAHPPGFVAGLLGQFPGRSDVGQLTIHVQQSGGDLPQGMAHGVAVLADQQHPVLLVDGQHGDGTCVPHVLAVEAHPVGEVHGVAHQVPHHAAVQHLSVDHLAVVWLIAQFVHDSSSVGAGWTGSTSSRRVARCASSAAPIRPANSGWARVGRDFISGWAWVPM